jgi:hypothetical protein
MQRQVIGKTMPMEKFLTIAVNLLNKAFLEAGRASAKRLYRDLEAGKDVVLTHLQMEDKSLVRIDLALDHERYQGKLSYGSFRTGLAALLRNAVELLQAGEPLRTFRAEDNPNNMLFGVFSMTKEDGKVSVLSLGSESGGGQPRVRLCLAYIEPLQFEELPDDEPGAQGPATA